MTVVNFSAAELGTFAALCTKLNLLDFNLAVDLCVTITDGNARAYNATYEDQETVYPESRSDIYNEALTAINDPTRMIYDPIGGMAYNMVSNGGRVFAGSETTDGNTVSPLLKKISDLENQIDQWRETEIDKATQADLKSSAAAMNSANQYEHLTKASDKLSGSKLAAKNIRIELKKQFPGTKFSVRSDYNSVRVKWKNGPSKKSVQAFTSRHDSGTFDGMTDCAGWDHTNVFGQTYGECRYVTENRDVDDDANLIVSKAYAASEGLVFDSMNDYANREHNYCSISRIILAGYDIPAGHRVTGIKATDVTCGSAVAYDLFYSITTEPIPADVVKAAAAKAKAVPFTDKDYLSTKAYPNYARKFRELHVAERELAKLAKKGYACEIVNGNRFFKIRKKS